MKKIVAIRCKRIIFLLSYFFTFSKIGFHFFCNCESLISSHGLCHRSGSVILISEIIVLNYFFMSKIYYTAPSEVLFQEMKTLSIEIWSKIHSYYPEEKVEYVKSIENVRDNFMFLLAMFDEGNQQDLLDQASEELKEAVRIRIESVQ